MNYQEAVQAQPQIIRHLKRSMDQSKLSHAYIFEGSKDSFVEEIAIYFAVLLLCGNEDHPTITQRVTNRTHPNVHIIESSTQTVTKDDILSLQHDFNQTAVEIGPKIYIIMDAHKMNAFAANALLKFLEEPHSDIYGILVTDDAQKLLPTLISRSQVLPFPSLGKKVIEKRLIEEGIDTFKAKIAAHLFQRVDRALSFIEDPDTDRIIDGVKGLYKTLKKGQSLLVFLHHEWPDLTRDSKTIELFLELMMLYQKDLLYAKMGVEEAITFKDDLTTIEGLNTQLSKPHILAIWEKILNLKEKLHHPIHHSLAFEDVVLSLERGIYET